ncbi:MAG: type II toxin-antitoxin system VapC family toxin [bacterium]|nr:type II toxin-antitoxin system VapC family toxin [bacterium]
MRIYLDNCCYNRPYDDQSQIRISLETQAKLYIQDTVKRGQLELVTSYVLEFENSNNRSMQKRLAIENFMNANATVYVTNKDKEIVERNARSIMETGIKVKDACHVACAILAECNYFITTDDRLLKYCSEQIQLVSPCEFIRKMEADEL